VHPTNQPLPPSPPPPFQIPSNLLLLRWGGPTWLATLAATWGSVAAACAAINGPASFLLLRLALGAAEAGAFPGLWYYVTCFWAPSRTTLPLAVIETGITASQVVAAPLSAGVLSLDGVGGLAGWRWLFLLEGLPALVLAAGIW
jgi:predicted MFS family arabinose efflux permease